MPSAARWSAAAAAAGLMGERDGGAGELGRSWVRVTLTFHQHQRRYNNAP